MLKPYDYTKIAGVNLLRNKGGSLIRNKGGSFNRRSGVCLVEISILLHFQWLERLENKRVYSISSNPFGVTLVFQKYRSSMFVTGL
jgi:hypothetical protein